MVFQEETQTINTFIDFVESVHCQLFHSGICIIIFLRKASKIYLRDYYRSFIKEFVATLNRNIVLFLCRHDKHVFMWTVSNMELKHINSFVTTLNTIIHENQEPAFAFFDEVCVDGVQTIQLIPEFVKLLGFLQV